MGKLSTKTRTVRSAERDRQIDCESDGAVRASGIEDRESLRELIKEMGKGRRVWGLQAVHDKDGSIEAADPYISSVSSGEISGWPLDPSRYTKDGVVIDKNGHANGNGNGNGRVNGNEHTDGVVNGIDIRGMVPGAIPIVKVDPVPEDIPPHLNIP